MHDGVEIVAEVKTKSPFGYESKMSWDELFEIADRIGDVISVHTDERWGGGFDLIKKARSLTNKQILAKGIHSSDSEIEKAIEAGADCALVVGRVPNFHRERCWIEPLDLKQLAEIPSDMKVVWNARDLESGAEKKESFEDARRLWKGWMCQASFVKDVSDIKEGADAVLVGEHLEEFALSLERAQ